MSSKPQMSSMGGSGRARQVGVLGVVLASTLVHGCRAADQSTVEVQAVVVAEPVASVRPAVDLRADGRRVLGIPVPDEFTAVASASDQAQFRSSASLAAITEFYVVRLPGYAATRHSDGVKLESPDGGADVYIIERGDHRDVHVMSALRSLPEFAVVPAINQSEAAAERAAVGPGPQGPVAPPAVIEAIRRDRGRAAAGEMAFASSLWEEHYEEIGGVRTRVLSPRTAPEAPVAEGNARSAEALELGDSGSPRLSRSPAGGYERGDGYRSLRATPEVDEQGRPLPFRGGERVPGDHTVPH